MTPRHVLAALTLIGLAAWSGIACTASSAPLPAEGEDDQSDAAKVCKGSYGKTPAADGEYDATTFGCWLDENGTPHTDPGDNCIPACLSTAKKTLCKGMSGPACERSVAWYSADAARYGCMTRLKVTNEDNGKAVVVVALDYGPSCSLENAIKKPLIDLSMPASNYLFGGPQGYKDGASVHVDVVPAATPLGPVDTASSSSATGGGSTSSSSASTGSGGPGSIWQPAPGTTWQWQLTGTIDTSVDVAMYDIDLFDAPQATIDTLKNAGRAIVCYFSAGTREDWRADANQFNASDYKNGVDGWAGENWLDVRSANVRAIMKKRLDVAVAKGCSGVEPDNVDGYDNDTGFPLTKQDQLDFNAFIASEAHARGLSVGLKNATGLVSSLVTKFDWALNEECLAYSECDTEAPFIAAGKAVFHVEYVTSTSQGNSKAAQVCGDPTTKGFSTLVKLSDLDAWRVACP